MNGKCVSVLLGGLYPDLLYIILLLLFVKVLLYDKFSRTIRWDFMTARDSCVNEGRHVFGALKLLGQVERQELELGYVFRAQDQVNMG